LQSTILKAIKDDLDTRGVDSTKLSGISDKHRFLLVKVKDHYYKLKIVDDLVIIMLRQCLNINGLLQKSPYGKAYEEIGSITLADPNCFVHLHQLLCKRWF
jgi:hypothetical protein